MDLSPEDFQKAREWFDDHKPVVEPEGPAYAPTGSDRGHPELWKKAHWRWFSTQVRSST